MSDSRGETARLYELPRDLPPVQAIRGSIVFLDWSWLKAHGHYDAYAAAMAPAFHDVLLATATSDWLGVDFLVAHYRALDAVGLSYEQAFSVGRMVGERAHGAVLSTILRLAGSLGASPWFALGHAHKMWERSWRGGGIAITRTGERTARVDAVGNPSAFSAFHRASFAGAFSIGMELLTKNVRLDEIPRLRTDHSFALSLAWA